MIVKLHKNARTTPAIRAQLAASNEPVAVLAKRFNLAPNTVRKWQARTEFNDRSHTAHNLQTTLSSAQEHIVIYLRKHLLLPLDDLLSVTQEFLCPEVSRSGLNRCLRRHGVGNLRDMTRSQDTSQSISASKTTPSASFISTSSTYHRWPMRASVDTSSSPLIEPLEWSVSSSGNLRPLRMPESS